MVERLMKSDPGGREVRAGPLFALLVLLLFAAGCVSPLPAARKSFYAGDAEDAAERLVSARAPERDQVLLWMERGTVLQAMGQYEESSRDFIAAADLIEEMETRSLVHGAAGTVTDDRALRFRGAPFERTLLHAFTAMNHLALGHWDNAAVESRRILQTLDPDVLGGYPEDAFSRYVAGFGFQLIDDPSNAALQFRRADELAGSTPIDEAGRISNGSGSPGPELVVFILWGRSPSGREVHHRWGGMSAPPSAELYAGDRPLGSAVVLADTADLAITTAAREAAKRTARALARIAMKETAARALDREDGLLGFLFRVILIDILEQPDLRRWETLPRFLMVGRVPCPLEEESLRLVIRTPGGGERTLELQGPFARRRATRVAVVRVMP